MQTISKALLREPLVHFLVLAAILFAADYLWSAAKKETIIVDKQTAEFLIRQRQDLELRELRPAEREETIASFVEDEILYREAYKRGLDKSDSRMRRNMILKMRGLLVGEVTEPTEKQLREYYDANIERFVRPASLSLEQVFFSDSAGVPDGLLGELRAGRDPASVGESTAGLGRSLPQMSQRDLVGVFGPEAARAILSMEDDRWHGPLESTYGSHFVRVVGREAAQQASYEDVRDYLAGDWRMRQSRRAIEREVERLSEVYEIVIEDSEGPAR